MEWLIKARKSKHLTQHAVAKASNISQPTYANIELGKRSPGVGTAKAIARVLGFDWTEFFKETA